MHIFFGLAFGAFLAWLIKEYGLVIALKGTLYGLLSCLATLMLAEYSYSMLISS